MSFFIANRPSQLQRLVVYQSSRTNPQWLPVLLLKIMGYSSFATAIIGIIVYWYRKQLVYQQQQRLLADNDDQLHMKPKKMLQITTNSKMRRSNSTLINLSHQKGQVFTPPRSPISLSSSSTNCSSWSSRLFDGVFSNIRGKKKLTISLKNTILWNPSTDGLVNPNHAFHENTVSLLHKLARLYDMYIIIHMNSDQEHNQINRLLVNANLLNPLVIDKGKVHWCRSEQEKVQVINRINPFLHVEGGSENGNGSSIIDNLGVVERIIWIGRQHKNLPTDIARKENIEYAAQILDTSIAKEAGFC